METLLSTRGLLVCLLAVLLIWGAGPAARSSSSCGPALLSASGQESEKTQILQVITRMQDAWNRGDFRGYMQGFKNPDVIFVSGGRFQDGWQGTLEHYIR